MTKIIGLTGGIGSGKTTVARMFEDLGVPVYIADDAGREVMQLPDVVQELQAAFPAAFKDGKLDRKEMAAIVFSDTQKLEQLNKIVHPAVARHFEHWLRERSGAAIIIKETAILFETGSDKQCDLVITVVAPFELKIERVTSRDNISRDAVLKRMENQWTDDQKAVKSDYVIDNITLDETRAQVLKIFNSLKKL